MEKDIQSPNKEPVDQTLLWLGNFEVQFGKPVVVSLLVAGGIVQPLECRDARRCLSDLEVADEEQEPASISPLSAGSNRPSYLG